MAHILDSKAFIMGLLTGEYVSDYSTANSIGCLDVDGTWDQAIIEAVGFQCEHLPRVANGFREQIALRDSVCVDLGVKKGTRVCLGLYDGAAVAAALTGFEAEIAVGNFGTSGMFRIPCDAPIYDFAGGAIQSCLLKPGAFFAGSGINNCTIASGLLLKLLAMDVDGLSGGAGAVSVPASNGLMTFPYFTGERDKTIGNIGTGVVVGLGIGSTREDLARSFLEGVAYSFLFVMRKLDPNRAIKELRLGGGGTANRLWMQIIADVLNLPLRLTQNPEMGIIGAACLARHGDRLVESSRRVMRAAQLIEPIAANVAIYQEFAERYFTVRAALREPLLARQRVH